MFSSPFSSKFLPSVLSFFVGVATSGAIFGTLYSLYGYGVRKYRERYMDKENSEDGETFTEVLMFPDKHVACKDNFLLESGCLRPDCRFSHYKTSLSEIYSHLCAAKKSICVCVFHITHEDLVDILIAMHRRRGVQVQVITDDENVDFQVWKLKDNNIPVRTDNSSYFMHHKFTVIDRRIVIHGSFNWTFGAINGNLENVLITNETDMVQNFQKEFDMLWKNFGLIKDKKQTNGCLTHIPH